MAAFDDAAFSRGFNSGWQAAKVLPWELLDELDKSADIMRRAEKYESCGYWCGRKAGQENFNTLSAQPYPVDSAGMLLSYDAGGR